MVANDRNSWAQRRWRLPAAPSRRPRAQRLFPTNIEGVSFGADAAGAAALNVKSAAGVLGSRAQQLRSQIDQFLGKIRVA
jgi:hypothetical protein